MSIVVSKAQSERRIILMGGAPSYIIEISFNWEIRVMTVLRKWSIIRCIWFNRNLLKKSKSFIWLRIAKLVGSFLNTSVSSYFKTQITINEETIRFEELLFANKLFLDIFKPILIFTKSAY